MTCPRLAIEDDPRAAEAGADHADGGRAGDGGTSQRQVLRPQAARGRAEAPDDVSGEASVSVSPST